MVCEIIPSTTRKLLCILDTIVQKPVPQSLTPLQVRASIIGRGCRIGKGAVIENSYLHDFVTVWEGAKIRDSMLCQGVTVMPKARVLEGSIISFKAGHTGSSQASSIFHGLRSDTDPLGATIEG